jgi:hypothetical protein
MRAMARDQAAELRGVAPSNADAAAHRTLAARDREDAARDREQAAKERLRSLVDREALAREARSPRPPG